MDPAKLKVTELRAELSTRGLDTRGVKAVLVDRLRQALEEETGEDVPETSIVDTSTDDTSLLEEKSLQYSEPEKEVSSDSKDQDSEPQREPSPEPEREQEQTSDQDSNVDNASQPVDEQDKSQSQEVQEQTTAEVELEEEESQDMNGSEGKDEYHKQDYEEKPDVTKYQNQGFDEDTKKENHEVDVKPELDSEGKQECEVKEEQQDQNYKQEEQSFKQEDDSHQDRKRKRSPQRQGWGQRDSWVKKDDEPEIDNEAMLLGWYDSDLNLEIDKTNFLEANPMSVQGFGYIWAGSRATFGFNQGKVCYEVKLLENNDVSHLEDEPSPHVLRVGWSVLTSSMLLGEEHGSYGFGGTGKASTNCKFTDYGTTFVAGDTVTAYLDYGDEDGAHVKMSYAINGVHHGNAFNFPASDISHQPLFPHLLSKNIKFRVNFGQSEAEFPLEEGYTWACQVAADKREPGPRRPERREDCEMLMMCGLPGCGKTTWGNAYVQENPGKFYNILGTNNLIDKMKIQGLPRKRNYHGRWDVLIDKCTKCLNKLLEMAARRRRNYILDQTNVYPSAQKRKMRNFAGFVRRAIVIVPTDEEFQRRVAKREAEEGKDVPDSAVLEMKANFRLPEVGESFDEVRYIELSEEESRPLVEQYNKEGKDAGFAQQAPFSGQAKRQRNDRGPPFRGGGGGGFRGGRGGGFRGGMDRRDRGQQRDERDRKFRPDAAPLQGGMDRSGRGWQPRGGGDRGPSRGGWRDRSPAFEREDRGPGGGGAWRNDRNSRDRPAPYDRNQRGGGRGGRPGGYDRDNFREDHNRGGGYDRGYDRGGYEREEFPARREGGFRENRGGGGARGGRGGFDREGGRGGRGGGGGGGGFDRRGGGGSGGGGFSDRRGGGNRDGGFDRSRGTDRGQRDNKVLLPCPLPLPPHVKPSPRQGGSNNQEGQSQGWGNQGGNQGYNQGNNNWGQYSQGGYNQGGYNQAGYNQAYNQGNQQQQPQQQQGWGQQGWGNKGYNAQGAQQVQGAAATGTQAAATGYNTAGYGQQAGYTQQQQQQYAQQYWGQYGYGQGWTQNADGTYSYPQGWQQYGYNYGQAATPAMAAQATGAAAAPANTAAAPANK